MADKTTSTFWRVQLCMRGGGVIWLESTTEPSRSKGGALANLTLTETSWRPLHINWQEVEAIAIKAPDAVRDAARVDDDVDVLLGGVEKALEMGIHLKHTLGPLYAPRKLVDMGLNQGRSQKQLAQAMFVGIETGQLRTDQIISGKGPFAKRGLKPA